MFGLDSRLTLFRYCTEVWKAKSKFEMFSTQSVELGGIYNGSIQRWNIFF